MKDIRGSLPSLSGGKRRDRERPRTSENQARKSVAPDGKLGINISCVLQSPLEKLKRNMDACANVWGKKVYFGQYENVEYLWQKIGGKTNLGAAQASFDAYKRP